MVSTEGYEESEKEHWNESVKSIDRYSSVGIQGFPTIINKYRKKSLFPIITNELDNRGIQIDSTKILDAGCGTGIYSEWYARSGADVVGIDLSDSAIENIKELNIPGTYQQSSLDNLSFPDDTFDIVHSFSVLYHIVDDDDWEQALMEMARVLKPGGLMLLRIDWVDQTERVTERRKIRNKQAYLNIFHKNGLSVDSIQSFPDQPMFKKLTTRLPSKNVPLVSQIASIFPHLAVSLGLFKQSDVERLIVLKN